MKRTSVLIVLSILLLVRFSVSHADVSTESMAGEIDILQLDHPYLFFSHSDLPDILDRIETETECSDIYQRLAAESNRYLHTPVEPFEPVEEEGFYSARLPYLRAQRKAAETLAFMYQITGEQKYADKSYEFADSICDVADWVNGYHQFPVIYSRVWPWNVRDDQVNFSVDLEAAHTAFSLALVYDLLYDGLDKHRRNRIRGALLEKVITRVRGNYEYHWWATSYRCNWCSVCNSCIGISALALLTEDPNLVDVVAESYNRITRTLDEIGQDGGWQEGCGYWNYMMRTSIEFGDVLKRVTGGAYNIFDHPKIKNNTVNCAIHTLIPPDITVNFGDSGKGRVGHTYFYNKIAAETGSHEASWYRENLFGDGTAIFDILWPRSSVKPRLPDTKSHHFSTVGWTVMRSSFTDTETVTIAAKAGYHNDPHHGHLDSGHFILYWRGEGFVSEMGRGSYDERYFQETRWEYPQASCVGHNIVMVNGEEQLPEKHKDEPWQYGIGGKILDFRTDDTCDYTLLDATGAYPGKELKHWRRHIILDKPEVTVILDEVSTSPGNEITLRFHSETDQAIQDRYLLLDGEKGDMALIPVTVKGFDFRAGKHPVMRARGLTMKLATFLWDPYCDVVVNASEETTVVATIIVPCESAKDLEATLNTVNFESDSESNAQLEFEFNNNSYTYRFRNEKDGLMLEK